METRYGQIGPDDHLSRSREGRVNREDRAVDVAHEVSGSLTPDVLVDPSRYSSGRPYGLPSSSPTPSSKSRRIRRDKVSSSDVKVSVSPPSKYHIRTKQRLAHHHALKVASYMMPYRNAEYKQGFQSIIILRTEQARRRQPPGAKIIHV